MDKYTLFYINGCPGARAVRLYMKYKNIECEDVLINLSKGEHRTNEFLRLNPMHTVPTLKIETPGGKTKGIYESRIILKYLDNIFQYNDIEIDKWLYWDLGFLSPNVGKIIYPRLFRNEEPDLKDLPNLIEKFHYLDNKLSENIFLTGNKMTIADLSSAMLVENSQICGDLINVKDYHNISVWLETIKKEIGEEKWGSVMNPFYSTFSKK